MAIVAIFAKNRKIIEFVNKQMAKLELIFVLDKQAFSKLAAILESVSSLGTNGCLSFTRAKHVKSARHRGKCLQFTKAAASGRLNLWCFTFSFQMRPC